MDKTLHLECACYSHIIQLKTFEDEQDIYMAIYGPRGKASWKYKLRTIWRILKHGTPYHDHTILSPEEQEKFALFLIEHKQKTEE